MQVFVTSFKISRKKNQHCNVQRILVGDNDNVQDHSFNENNFYDNDDDVG